MNPLDCAAALKQEADALLYGSGIDRIVRAFGEVFYTESYFLDLMAWRDIDVHLVLEPDACDLDRFWEMGRQLAQLEGVHRSNFLNTRRHPRKDLPPGFYWGVKLDTKQGAEWKIDIWATEAPAMQRNRAGMERIANALTEDTRRSILEIKHALMLPEGRTPIMSGVHIYEAVLFNGLRDLESIRGYLREQGVAGV